jgi:hypothetical protein
MATINVEVQFEALENTELNNFVDELYSFLRSEGRKSPAPFKGTVVNVSELDREEDEENGEEETGD